MNTQCLVYVTDIGYLFPTIVSAIQAKKNSLAEVDVIVVLSVKLARLEDVRAALSATGIILLDASEALAVIFSRLDKRSFSGKISMSAVGRLVLDDLLPPPYKTVIYLDGDTQVLSGLAALQSTPVPDGKFFAARDYMAIKSVIETTQPSTYFNSGLLKFNRSNWPGREALDYFIKHPEKFAPYHDQGALNAVGASSHIMISNRWNFPKQFLMHVPDRKDISIVHYMAHPKPWQGTYFPWGHADSAVYGHALNTYPLLREFFHDISLARKFVYRYRSIKEAAKHSLSADRLWDLRPVLAGHIV